MAQNQVILQFRFTTFGDCMMEKMNFLRRQKRFCDVVVRINELEVPGHKVVFAAGSSFLRDQFILQQDAREVQISLIQEAEVGRQLLLSCYTGQLEFPELELVHYLTVASFLQMGHIVEQCTQALNKFIKPPPRDLEMDRARDRKEEELSSHPQRELEYPQTQAVHQEDGVVEQVEDEDDDGDDDDDDNDDDDVDVVIMQHGAPPPPPPQSQATQGDVVESDITIVKVESVMDAAENSLAVPSSPPAALHSPEPQHSLINSTVDTRATELAVLPAPGHPLGLPPQSLMWKHGNQGGGYQRSYDKPIQWYHQCPKCARIFRQLENYANHLKMHKLFMCLLCGKTFTQKGNLHRHMRVHAGIKPFQCKICGKTFTQKCSLLDHLNLHSGDKPHRCNYCEMVFAHKPVLRKHLKQIHGKNSFDNANERSLQDGGLDFEYGRV